MYKVICSMMSRQESLAFREPVDWKTLGLFDYLEVVKKPMDLGTVKMKMEKHKYETLDDIAADIRLVWHNCMLYNRDGSEFYHLADKFARGFEEAYAALRRLEETNSDMDRIPSVEQKLQLSYDIFKITNTDMGCVLTMIENACPSAISKRTASDEVLINFDALTPRCFHEVNSFVLNCILSISGSKKNKKRKLTGNEGGAPSGSGDGGSASEAAGETKSSEVADTTETATAAAAGEGEGTGAGEEGASGGDGADE